MPRLGDERGDITARMCALPLSLSPGSVYERHAGKAAAFLEDLTAVGHGMAATTIDVFAVLKASRGNSFSVSAGLGPLKCAHAASAVPGVAR